MMLSFIRLDAAKSDQHFLWSFNSPSSFCCSLYMCVCVLDVGGYFETGTLVRYDFLPEAATFALQEMKSLSGVGVPSEANLTQEELVFSFSTSSTPSILVYISSRTQDYMAVVLRHNGGLIIIVPDLLFL